MRHHILLLFFGLSFNAYSQGSVLKIEPLRPDVYGSSCGIVGEDPQLRKTIEHLIVQADMNAIDAWLFSDNATRKVYAVEALIRMNEDGIQLSESQRDGIRRTKQMDDIISTCAGCLMGQATVKEVLQHYSLD